MVPVAGGADGEQLVLQLLDVGHSCASEVVVRDRIRGEAPFAEVGLELAILGEQAAERKGGRSDGAFVAAIPFAGADSVLEIR